MTVSTTTMKNVPFNQTFAMLSYTNYNTGTDIRRSRFAWDGFGNMKVFNDRDLAGNGGAWYAYIVKMYKNSMVLIVSIHHRNKCLY